MTPNLWRSRQKQEGAANRMVVVGVAVAVAVVVVDVVGVDVAHLTLVCVHHLEGQEKLHLQTCAAFESDYYCRVPMKCEVQLLQS